VPEEEVIIAADSLCKRFRIRRGREADTDLVAAEDVSFEVRAGASLAIVGESGAGKSTVARMLVGLERPTSGRITVCGRERGLRRPSAAERRRRGREVQIVFQDPYASLDPRQRVAAALDEVLQVHFGMTKSERAHRVESLLDQVGLDQRHGRSFPSALSGGQRQRVAIARAIAAQPRLLVLDEAVAALDVSIQAQVLNLLADIRDQTSTSYVFVSHDLAVVRQIADEIIVMNRGRVVERGRTSEVLDAPREQYTQVLLDSVPRIGWKPRTRVAP
jgi:ABC-type glutathione transport system ATPase component